MGAARVARKQDLTVPVFTSTLFGRAARAEPEAPTPEPAPAPPVG